MPDYASLHSSCRPYNLTQKHPISTNITVSPPLIIHKINCRQTACTNALHKQSITLALTSEHAKCSKLSQSTRARQSSYA